MSYKQWNNPNQVAGAQSGAQLPHQVAGAQTGAQLPHQVAGAQTGPWGGQPQFLSPSQSPAQQGPTQVSPTQQYVKPNYSNTNINHVHPSHTTNVNKHCITHKHYFPHTESVVNECKEQHIMCGQPYNPCQTGGWGPKRPW